MTGRKPPTGAPPSRRRTAASAPRSAATPDPLDTIDVAKAARLAEIREAAAPLRARNRALAAEREANAGPHAAQDREAIARRVQRLADVSAAQDAAASETLPGAKEWAAMPVLFLRLESTLSRWNEKQRSAAWVAMKAEKIASAATFALIANEKEAGATTRARRAAERMLRLRDCGEIARRPLALAASDIAAYGALMRGARDAAWLDGLDTAAPLADWAGRALALFVRGAPERGAGGAGQKLTRGQAAFLARMQRYADTGPDGQALPPEHVRRIEIEPAGPARGAPERAELDALADDLAALYGDLTGRPIQHSKAGRKPAPGSHTFDSFMADVAQAIPALPRLADRAHRRRDLPRPRTSD